MTLSKSKNKVKNICVVTGSRADFGIISNLLKNLDTHKKSRIKLIVTGTHLMKNYGMTEKEINQNKLKIFKKVFIPEKNEKSFDIGNNSSIILKELAKIFEILKPDLFIAIGDRYEMLISSYISTLFKVPIIHIGGGEQTVGSYDNQFRHSISKMSSLHFVSHHTYKERLIKMGENPNSIYNYGSLAIDNLKRIKPLTKQELEKKYRVDFKKKNFLVTFHPLTLDKNKSIKEFKQLIRAVLYFKNFNFIFTAANGDQDGGKINSLIQKYAKSYRNIFFIKSFGQNNYFSILRQIDGVIGNSSSGIIEVPSFKIGTVNIGDRQKGRYKSKSIIDCKQDYNEIIKAIKKISSKDFITSLKNTKNPFEKKNTLKKMIKKIHNYNYSLKKTFYEKYTS